MPIALFRSVLLVSAALVLGACDDELLAPVSGRVEGIVCDPASGFPLGHAEVAVSVAGRDYEGTADRDGEFIIEHVASGQGEIELDEEGQTRSAEIVIVADETTFFVDEACRGVPGEPGTGGVRGVVCNRHVGDVVSGAQVTVILSDGTSLTTTSDEDGRYAFSGVPEGKHILAIQAPGYQTSTLIEVEDGETVEVDMGDTCRPATSTEGYLTGQLCDAAADGPLQGADVRVQAGDSYSFGTTDIDGNFLMGPLAAGPVTVTVRREPDVARTFTAVVVAGAETNVVSDGECSTFTGEGEGEPGPGEARVTGHVCAPNGVVSVADADVYIELSGGTRISTRTDENGNFTLEGVPPGQHTVHVVAGGFERTFDVTVVDDETVAIPVEDCEVDTTMRIAVVEGTYDPILTVLYDVGVDPAQIDSFDSYGFTTQLLGDYATLSSYDLVFISCGVYEDFYGNELVRNNIRTFVEQGGSVYASDWAYDLVEMAFPERVEFYGDDAFQDSAQVGNAFQGDGVITDGILAASIGSTSIPLGYPLGQWAMMESVASTVRVYIRGDAYSFSYDTYEEELHSNIPHTVSFGFGDGTVVYSSFHQEPGISVEQEQVLYQLMFQL